MASTLADNSSRTLPASGRKREQEIRLFASTRRYDCKRLQVALLALDLAELYNLGIRQRASSNTSFQRAVLQLAAHLRKDPGLSSSAQLDELAHAEKLRREMHPQFYMTAGT